MAGPHTSLNVNSALVCALYSYRQAWPAITTGPEAGSGVTTARAERERQWAALVEASGRGRGGGGVLGVGGEEVLQELYTGEWAGWQCEFDSLGRLVPVIASGEEEEGVRSMSV